MDYSKLIDPEILNVPLSGIRLVNSWPTKTPKSDLIYLNIGQPDLPTPEFIKDISKEAISKNFTRYTHIMGEEELRSEICRYLAEYDNLKYSPEQILVTSGGQSALFATIFTLLSQNENIVVPFPCYPPYINIIRYKRANILPIKTEFRNKFEIPLDKLESILESHQVKAILLVSPGNPTGALYTEKTLESIAKLSEKYNFLIFSDEIYNRITFLSKSCKSPAYFAPKRTIIIQSFSKMLSMTGYRIGFIAAPESLINIIKIVHHTMNICANSIAQYTLAHALRMKSELKNAIDHLRSTYEEMGKVCFQLLNESSFFNVINPQGAFYLFPQSERVNMFELAKFAKYNYGILTVPGIFFASPTSNEYLDYLRISFTLENILLERGIKRLCKAFEDFISKKT